MLDTPLRRHPQAVADLVSLINGGAMAQALSVAAELGIPDLLAHGPKQAEEMARATETHAPSLRRLLKALSSVGACRECDDGSFALGPIGTLVRSDRTYVAVYWRTAGGAAIASALPGRSGLGLTDTGMAVGFEPSSGRPMRWTSNGSALPMTQPDGTESSVPRSAVVRA